MKSITIPPFLKELFGNENTRETVWFSLVSAVICALLVLFLGIRRDYPMGKLTLLIVLALDLGGGIPSNLSRGTNEFYARTGNARRIFPLLHLIQPFLLGMLFPADTFRIWGIGLFTVAATFVLDRVEELDLKRVLSGLFLVINVILLYLVHLENSASFLLLIFAAKLLIAWQIRETKN